MAKNKKAKKNPDTNPPGAYISWENFYFRHDKEVGAFLELMAMNSIMVNFLEQHSREEINKARHHALIIIRQLTKDNINRKFGEGNTLLHILVYRGVYAVVDLILGNGWNLNLINMTNNKGQTIFDIDIARVKRLGLSSLSQCLKKFLERHNLTYCHQTGMAYLVNILCFTDFPHAVFISLNGHQYCGRISLFNLFKFIANGSEHGSYPIERYLVSNTDSRHPKKV